MENEETMSQVEKTISEAPVVEMADVSDDEEEDEVAVEAPKIEPEDNHDSGKIVLQRQFFEAIVRAASVKYAAGSDLPNLAVKLEHLFKNNLIPMAVKNRSKSVEEVKEWRLADKVFEADDIAKPLAEVFAYFSTKAGTLLGGRKDETLKFSELIDMLKRAKLLEEPGSQSNEANVSMK